MPEALPLSEEEEGGGEESAAPLLSAPEEGTLGGAELVSLEATGPEELGASALCEGSEGAGAEGELTGADSLGAGD
jgi:hypothetical protein